jgi:uncharacterized protein (TIRG00374 family)
MKKALLQTLKWVLSLGLIAWLYSRVDRDAFVLLLQGARPWMLLPVAAILILNLWISALKWSIFLRADGIHESMPHLFASYWIGSFVSLFLPSNIGGDGYRIYALGKRTKQGMRSFTSVFAERLSGFIALTSLGLVGGILGYALIRSPVVLLVVAAFLGLFSALLLFIFKENWAKRLLALFRMDRIGGITKAHRSIVESFLRYRGNPGLLSSVMSLGYVTVVFCYSRFLGMDAPFLWFLVLMPIIAIFEALPFSVYGIGIRDTAYVYFFAQVGMPREHALALALTHVTVNVLLCSVGGLLLLLRRNQEATRSV